MFKLDKRYKLQEKELLGEGQPAGDSEPEVDKNPETVPYSEFAALKASNEAMQESNKKMEQHMETLLGEKKAEKARRQEAERLAEQEAIEKSKQSNNLEEFEKQITSQFQAKETGYQSKIEQFTSKLIAQSQKASFADFTDDFADKGTASLALNQMIKVTLDDELNPVREFRDLEGNLITTDPKVFKEYLEANHASWLKGAQSSGGLNSAQTPASGGGQAVPNKPFDKMSASEKVAYLKAKKK